MNIYTIEYIKRILENFRYVTSEIKMCQSMMEEIDVKRGVHAVRYDKESTQGSSDPVTKAINQLELTEQYHYWQLRLESAVKQKQRIDMVLSLFDEELKPSAYAIHCLHKTTYFKESKRLHMDESTLKRRINREIEHIATEFTII